MSRPGEQPRLWSASYVLAIVTNTLFTLVFYMLMTTMALYAAETFGASDGPAGLAASAFVVGALVARLFAHRLIDRVGAVRLLRWTAYGYVLASLSYLVVGDLVWLLVVRFVHGMAFGMANTAVSAGVQGLIPESRRGEGTSFYMLSATLATALGPLLGISLLSSWGYDGLFWGSVAVSGLTVLVALLIHLPPPVAPSRPRRGIEHLVEPRALPVALVVALMGVAFSGVVTFLNPYAEQAGILAGASAFFVVYSVAAAVSRPFLGRVQDRRGDNLAVYPALACFAGGTALLAGATTEVLVAAAGALVGVGFGTMTSTLQAVAVKQVRPDRVGAAVSTFFLFLDAGIGVGPFVLGLVVEATGYATMFLLVSGVVLASAVVYHAVHGARVSVVR